MSILAIAYTTTKPASDSFWQGFVHTIECVKLWRRFILNTNPKYSLYDHFQKMLNNKRTVKITTTNKQKFIKQLFFARNDVALF